MKVRKNKITNVQNASKIINRAREKGKITALCHGCFDLMHPGHIQHFLEASEFCDFLFVSVTPDRYIDKGEGRPVFSEKHRSESIAALECVDHVLVNEWKTASELLEEIRPDYYVKGQEFAGLEDGTGKLHIEKETADRIGCELKFTKGDVFSSTELIEKYIRNQGEK